MFLLDKGSSAHAINKGCAVFLFRALVVEALLVANAVEIMKHAFNTFCLICNSDTNTRDSALAMVIGKRCCMEHLKKQKTQNVEAVNISFLPTEFALVLVPPVALKPHDMYPMKLSSFNEVVERIEILRHMQLDDMQMASHLMLMAREMQDKVHEKNNFIARLRFDYEPEM
ncbi:hypothetical protein Tco_0173395 [Tanacetum coccineum]